MSCRESSALMAKSGGRRNAAPRLVVVAASVRAAGQQCPQAQVRRIRPLESKVGRRTPPVPCALRPSGYSAQDQDPLAYPAMAWHRAASSLPGHSCTKSLSHPNEYNSLLGRRLHADTCVCKAYTPIRTQAHRHHRLDWRSCRTASWPIRRQGSCPVSNLAILCSPLFEDTS